MNEIIGEIIGEINAVVLITLVNYGTVTTA
jgi:hypothetical protein